MRWVVLEELRRDNRIVYRVACSECGAEKFVRKNMIQLGTRCKVCLTIDRNRSNKGKHRGVGGLTKTFFNHFKNTAKRRDIEFSVTLNYLWNLYEKQNGACALSGLPISLPTHTGIGGAETSANSASLDRIDSSKGYVEGNVQWVHKIANIAKNDLSQEGFIALCHAVASQHANPQPSVLTGVLSHRWSGGRKPSKTVGTKVQRLTGESSSSISPTRVPSPCETQGDEIVRHSEETRRAQDKEPAYN